TTTYFQKSRRRGRGASARTIDGEAVKRSSSIGDALDQPIEALREAAHDRVARGAKRLFALARGVRDVAALARELRQRHHVDRTAVRHRVDERGLLRGHGDDEMRSRE